MYLGLQISFAQDAVDALLDEIRLAFLDQQDASFPDAEPLELFVYQGIGDVQHIQWHLRLTKRVGQSQQFQRTQHAVVKAALHDDAEVLRIFRKKFIEFMLLDELDGGRPALRHLFLLMQVAGRWQHNAVHIAHRIFHRVFQRERGPLVVLCRETSMHMAGADTQLQHHRGVAGFGQLKPHFNGPHNALQIGPRVDQPHLRLHREGMGALLHDAGALAVILADYQQGAAGHAAGGQVGQRVRGHVGADSGLEGHCAAQRIIDGRGQRGSGGSLGGAVFKVNTKLLQDVVGVGQDVHQVRDRRTLVTRHIRHARLQQRLGDGQNAFAAKLLTFAQAQLQHFSGKRAFSHGGVRSTRSR